MKTATPPLPPTAAPRALRAGNRAVIAQRIDTPADAPGIKRFPLHHAYAKAFYLSTSTDSISKCAPFSLGSAWVIDDGTKRSAVATSIVETFPVDPAPSPRPGPQS